MAHFDELQRRFATKTKRFDEMILSFDRRTVLSRRRGQLHERHATRPSRARRVVARQTQSPISSPVANSVRRVVVQVSTIRAAVRTGNEEHRRAWQSV